MGTSGYTWPRMLRPLERWWFRYRLRKELDQMIPIAKQLAARRAKTRALVGSGSTQRDVENGSS